MDILVKEQTQRFYLASNEWKAAVGHEIKVGNYKFCAIPLVGKINISEVASGCKILDIPMNFGMMMATETKEGAIKLFYKIGETLKLTILSNNKFDMQLKQMRKTAFEKLGEMPPIENFDMDWLSKGSNDVLH